jgi:hypothetical protein
MSTDVIQLQVCHRVISLQNVRLKPGLAWYGVTISTVSTPTYPAVGILIDSESSQLLAHCSKAEPQLFKMVRSSRPLVFLYGRMLHFAGEIEIAVRGIGIIGICFWFATPVPVPASPEVF